MAGWNLANAGKGNPPQFNHLGTLDTLTAASSAVATLLALYHRQKTGEATSTYSSLLNTATFTSGETLLRLDKGDLAPNPELDHDQTGLCGFYRIYEVRDGWVRKSSLDAWLDRYLPVPTQVISNEEYLPIPQTPQQRRLEQEIIARAERQAHRLGMDRRRFLRTSCGMALAFAAMNTVFGRFFRVDAAELLEPSAVTENKAHVFIFDVQTHHVAMPSQAPHADQDFLKALLDLRATAREMNPALKNHELRIKDLYLENYIKEVFLDSDTVVIAEPTDMDPTSDSALLRISRTFRVPANAASTM